MNTQTITEQTKIQNAWDRIAVGYDTYVTPTHAWLANEAIRRAGIRSGLHFLDVAAGSGALSMPAARTGAKVLATDLSPLMIKRLSERAQSEGLSNIETHVMDGQALELEDNTFDVAGSQFGVMLFPDLPRGLREMVRVTKPGGHVLMVVYGPPTEVEFLTFFLKAIKSVVPNFNGFTLDPAPLPFQVADPDKLRQALIDAGLKDIRLETLTEKLTFESSKQMWNWMTNSNPIGAMLVADFTEDQKTAIRQALDRLLSERSGGNGPAVLTNPVHICIGTK